MGFWSVEVAEASVSSILLRLGNPTVIFENVGKAKTNTKNHDYLTRCSKN